MPVFSHVGSLPVFWDPKHFLELLHSPSVLIYIIPCVSQLTQQLIKLHASLATHPENIHRPHCDIVLRQPREETHVVLVESYSHDVFKADNRRHQKSACVKIPITHSYFYIAMLW